MYYITIPSHTAIKSTKTTVRNDGSYYYIAMCAYIGVHVTTICSMPIFLHRYVIIVTIINMSFFCKGEFHHVYAIFMMIIF